MKRLILLLALATLVAPATALGKGPSAATMEGPGGGGGITFSGDEGSGPLGNLTQQSGWFAQAFPQDSESCCRPKGDLGPRYRVTYTVPTDMNRTVSIRQDIYPYAKSGPVTHMAPGQPIFDTETPGGWFQAGPELKQTLVAAGLPQTVSGGSSEQTSFPTTTVSLLAFALLLAGATVLLLRRRTRPAAA